MRAFQRDQNYDSGGDFGKKKKDCKYNLCPSENNVQIGYTVILFILKQKENKNNDTEFQTKIID